MKIKIQPSDSGRTLKALTKDLGISSSVLSCLKRLEDGILINGEKQTVRYVLRAGDLLSLNTEDRIGSQTIVPLALPVDILYEDDYLVAVNKPFGIPVHPVKRHQEDTLAARMLAHYADLPFVFRCLTRLDLDTSGAVLIAKDRVTAGKFSGMLARRTVRKEYLALCAGALPDRGEIALHIKRTDEKTIKRSCAFSDFPPSETGERGAAAETRYETASRSGGMSLVRVYPRTGRTHQIRVHLSAVGHPIIGDTLYGEGSALIGRQALHAYSLSFSHPVTGDPVQIRAPVPEDMQAVLDRHFKGVLI